MVNDMMCDLFSIGAQSRTSRSTYRHICVGSAPLSGHWLIAFLLPSMAARMNQPEAKPWINAIHAYTPGKAKSDDGRVLIKLSANENPLGCSADATAALVDARTSLARYPDPASTALREALGRHYGLESEQIVCGTRVR